MTRMERAVKRVKYLRWRKEFGKRRQVIWETTAELKRCSEAMERTGDFCAMLRAMLLQSDLLDALQGMKKHLDRAPFFFRSRGEGLVSRFRFHRFRKICDRLIQAILDDRKQLDPCCAPEKEEPKCDRT